MFLVRSLLTGVVQIGSKRLLTFYDNRKKHLYLTVRVVVGDAGDAGIVVDKVRIKFVREDRGLILDHRILGDIRVKYDIQDDRDDIAGIYVPNVAGQRVSTQAGAWHR